MTTTTPESVRTLLGQLLVTRFEVPADEVRDAAPMAEFLVDSLLVVEMAIAVHDEFGVKVEEEELRGTTLAEFAAVVEDRRSRA
ncbi:acyl carrier protein [Streptomyces sp. BI20]|uniref:acyl carrier protein n=1 Tax=Streptomyces sp. BI20 TaxID=3403460 RepID=UPI003C717FE7